jgi:methionyl aminopeptidase
MHEDPKVPNYVSKNLQTNDILLKTGMVIAVEPMINIGTYKTKVLKDGWTVVTADGKSSAHFEHSIAITDDGCKVLTEN